MAPVFIINHFLKDMFVNKYVCIAVLVAIFSNGNASSLDSEDDYISPEEVKWKPKVRSRHLEEMPKYSSSKIPKNKFTKKKRQRRKKTAVVVKPTKAMY